MNSYNVSTHNNFNSFFVRSILFLYVALTFLIGYYFTQNMHIEWDSMRYFLVAEEIGKGNGAVSPLLWFEGGPPISDSGKSPLTEQPPGYSFLLAILNTAFSDNVVSSKLINLATHILTGIVVFFLVYNLSPTWIALFSAFSITFSLPILCAVSSAWPEYVFSFTILFAVFCLFQSRLNIRSNFWWLLASIFSCFAIFLRYAGLFFIVVLFWEAFHRWKQFKFSFKHFFPVFLCPFLPILSFFFLIFKNIFYTGSIRGFSQPPPERSLFESAYGVYKLFFNLFSINNPFWIAFITLIFALTIIVFAYIFFFSSSFKAKDSSSPLCKNALSPLALTSFSYFCFIILIMYRNQPVFEERFLFPFIPIFFSTIGIISGCIYINIEKSDKFKKINYILFCIFISFFIGSSVLTVKHFDVLNKRPGPSRQIRESAEALEWLKNNKDVNIVATNRPFVISYFTKISVLRLPQRFHNPWFQIPDNMELILPKRMNEVGAEHLILIGKNLESKYLGKYITKLSKDEKDCLPFKLVKSTPTTKIYKLKTNL